MKLLHTMLRVGNLERSVEFYTKVLGMKEIKRSENVEYRYSLVFLGYDNSDESSQIELTYNWDTDSYDLGTAYGHIAIGTDDIYTCCEKIKAQGGNVTREPAPVKGGVTVIAFVRDPDNYAIELIQTGSSTSADKV